MGALASDRLGGNTILKKLTFAFLVLSLAVACGEDWSRGALQLHGAAGGNTMTTRGNGAEPSIGLGFARGMGRYVAVTGSYFWHRLASIDSSACLYEACFRAEARAVAHELLGGLRLNASNSSRATPYLVAGGGLVRTRASGSALGIDLSCAKVKPALGVGGGLDIRLGGPLAAIFDLRVVKASALRVYARANFGLGFRF